VVGGEGGDGADLAGGGIGQRDEVGDAPSGARQSAAGAVDGVEQPGGVGGVLRGGEELGNLGEGEGAGVGVIVMAGACGARLGDDPGGREGRGVDLEGVLGGGGSWR